MPFRIRSLHTFVLLGLLFYCQQAMGWGFFGHRRINYLAVFLLPPEMMALYKPYIEYLSEHAPDPDKRRYAVPQEAPRHYIDLDRYGRFPYSNLPRQWDSAVARFTEDTLHAHGIVPWWVQVMQQRLTQAFRQKNAARILQLSAEIGHYISDAHVPLHACSNHNGQHTNQHGIHGFWESRVPELFADSHYDFMIGKAVYLRQPGAFIWDRVLESAAAADSVLREEALLTQQFPADAKYAYEERQGKVQRQYSTAFAAVYQARLNGMVERRMRQSIFAVASFWYTAWVDAGQPNLRQLVQGEISLDDQQAYDSLNQQWLKGKALGRICD